MTMMGRMISVMYELMQKVAELFVFMQDISEL